MHAQTSTDLGQQVFLVVGALAAANLFPESKRTVENKPSYKLPHLDQTEGIRRAFLKALGELSGLKRNFLIPFIQIAGCFRTN